jgi:hypothetical protein
MYYHSRAGGQNGKVRCEANEASITAAKSVPIREQQEVNTFHSHQRIREQYTRWAEEDFASL